MWVHMYTHIYNAYFINKHVYKNLADSNTVYCNKLYTKKNTVATSPLKMPKLETMSLKS